MRTLLTASGYWKFHSSRKCFVSLLSSVFRFLLFFCAKSKSGEKFSWLERKQSKCETPNFSIYYSKRLQTCFSWHLPNTSKVFHFNSRLVSVLKERRRSLFHSAKLRFMLKSILARKHAALPIRSFRNGIYKLVLTFMVCFFAASMWNRYCRRADGEEVIQTILTSSFSRALRRCCLISFMLERAAFVWRSKLNLMIDDERCL